jgi:hypothetical protein
MPRESAQVECHFGPLKAEEMRPQDYGRLTNVGPLVGRLMRGLYNENWLHSWRRCRTHGK